MKKAGHVGGVTWDMQLPKPRYLSLILLMWDQAIPSFYRTICVVELVFEVYSLNPSISNVSDIKTHNCTGVFLPYVSGKDDKLI